MIEIERKFLVISEDFKNESFKSFSIKQGFLNTDPLRTVRVRLTGDKAYLTVKGKSYDDGLSRFEWEHHIPVEDALKLLKLCEDDIIEKERFLIRADEHVFEVDVFDNNNKGLIIAEIELKTKTESFTQPKWLGQEVTGDPRYYNAQLSQQPFKTWT
ncbi:MAG: CYTH domain-containing protein [Winogradskyella sp.]|nr:CYTH domain-containing protein [Winogradskyella sp.]MBT8376344.1 CYTH domain-containing protein [Bacteroidia bacterium]NNC44895.1 CYTH domain-containing protein [Winogradskyella sp.]